jgi:hypothetical protein
MKGQFTTTLMGLLSDDRNAMKDDVESQRRAMANAKRWQDGESAKIFAGRSGPAPSEATLSSSYDWPKTSMTTTSPSDVYARARSQAETEGDEPNALDEFDLEDRPSGAQDSEPTIMSFYAGRAFSEGRKMHNAYLVSQGRRPIPEGRR